MKTKHAFAKSLRALRKAKKVTQEHFSVVSSRTYISMLERGLKSPTLEKIEALAKVLKVHPLSLLYLVYLRAGGSRDVETLIKRIQADLEGLI
jgi:transcriptional regulator with XRE-family HTH domain